MTSIVFRVLVVTSLLTSHTVAKVIDLSHKHGPNTYMSWYGTPGYNLTNLVSGELFPGVYAEVNFYGTTEHGGTHMDAPRHFTPGGLALDEIPLEKTIAEGVMIDCADNVKKHGPNYTVPLHKVIEWEVNHGQIPQGAAVLFNFGWSSRFLDEAAYRGSTDFSDSATYVYPTVSITVARWLLYNRDIQMLGTDTLSPDLFGPKSGYPVHKLMLPQNRILIENLRDLHLLPARGFRFHSSPVKYVGASGSQVRAFAMTYEDDGNDAGLTRGSLLFAVTGFVVSTLPLIS